MQVLTAACDVVDGARSRHRCAIRVIVETPRDNERVLLIGTRSADHIMANGQSGRNNRPNTWPHPTIAATSNSSCTAGAVHTGTKRLTVRLLEIPTWLCGSSRNAILRHAG